MKIINDWLELTGMDQRELAKRLQMDQAALSRYINGGTEPGAKILQRLSESTGIKVEKLVASAAAA